jgi:hypothetical protein
LQRASETLIPCLQGNIKYLHVIFDPKGVDDALNMLSVGTMLLVSPLGGFLIHGTSANIPAETEATAYILEPLRFAWRPEKDALMDLLPQSQERAAGQGVAPLGSPD